MRKGANNPDVGTDTGYDVVIVGGGPAGSTAGTLLRKYNPSLRVLVLEKERFPRDHIGESQLPVIGRVLDEMGVWDKVEAADFPIKIGASYTWGCRHDRWDFDFYPVELWEDQPRPGKYEGQRVFSAFQVDRSRYDNILLRHAESMGVEVREQARVVDVHHHNDRITALTLADGTSIAGRYFIDGSGTAGLFVRSMNIPQEIPPQLRNIAVWDYWENAEWAVEIGVGATRIQVRSLPWGWIWFIPIGPTRTSIGLVCPAEHYKRTGLSPESLYIEALNGQPDIGTLIKRATRRGRVETCKDWSHLAERIAGENWFACGEAAGFADPILSAGMSLAHNSAREAAYIILELERGEHDPAWLRQQYNDRNRSSIRQHIRFGLYWYTANSCFTELREHCAQIASDAGLQLSPQQAWRWLSVGGFSNDATGRAIAGSFDVASAKQILELFDGHRKVPWLVNGYNCFKLNLRGAEVGKIAQFADGRVHRADCYVRGERTLPFAGYYGRMIDILNQTSDGATMAELIEKRVANQVPSKDRRAAVSAYIQALEIMIQEGWVERKINRRRPLIGVDHEDQRYIRYQADAAESLSKIGKADRIKSRI